MKPAAPRARRRMHPAWKVTIALLFASAAIGLAEVALRLFWTPPTWFGEFQQAGMYVATADGDVALMPGYRGTMQAGALVHVAIDSLGMRGPELGEKGDERRLLVLGDSLAWGHGVEAEQAFPALLQQHLRAAGLPFEVGNAGVPGYGERHMALQMVRLDEPFGADAFVVCGCLADDALDDVQPERTVFDGLALAGPWARLVHDSPRARLMYRSRLALWVESWLREHYEELSLVHQLHVSPEEAQRAAGFLADKLHAGLFFDVVDDKTQWDEKVPPVVPRHLALLRTSLQAMHTTAAGRPFVFVMLPSRFQVIEDERTAELRRLGFDPKKFERGLAQQRWMRIARGLEITALDATPILAAQADPPGLFLADGVHFTARGHEVVAAWLAQELARLLR